MLSPIAHKSALEARTRLAAGEAVKGTGRRVTSYAGPSLAEKIAAAPSIDALALVRDGLGELYRLGELTPDERTRRRWNEALWVRVLELITADNAPDCPTYVANVTLRWAKPAGVEDAIAAAVAWKAARLPAPAARFLIG